MTGEDGSQPSLKRLGTYELIRPIAQGGMADIYLAKKAGIGQFERRVAIKVLNKLRATEEESCAMFLDEARLVGMLDHQNIASVLEVNVEAGHHYLAMEYVHGADLRELLSTSAKAGRAIPFEVSLSIIAAAAAGLDHAHRRCDPEGRPLRLVHRDVSLSNIMVGHDGSVKVVDFGIASTAVQTVHTSPGVVRGKASYMSPEQCLGDEVDHKTDIFALGIVLYELTTGARCFAGKTDFDRMLAVVRGQYHPPTAIVANYPLELEQVIRTALAADPADRFASCAAMIEALERVARVCGWTLCSSPIERLMRRLYGRRTDNAFAVVAEQIEAEIAVDADADADADADDADDADAAADDDADVDAAAHATQPALFAFAAEQAPEPTAREAPSARRASLVVEAPLPPTPTERTQRRVAQGTNADGYATSLADGVAAVAAVAGVDAAVDDAADDDQPTRGRRPLPRRPSMRGIAA